VNLKIKRTNKLHVGSILGSARWAALVGSTAGVLLFAIVLRLLGFWPLFQDEQQWLLAIVSAGAVLLIAVLCSAAVKAGQGRIRLLLNTLLFSTTALIPMPVLSWLKNSPQRIPHTHTVTDRSELIFDLVVFGTWSLALGLIGWLLGILRPKRVRVS
jgi:hypothetical protein